MKKFLIILWFVWILCTLSACAKKEPSTILTEETTKEISVIQKDIEKSACENKDSLIARLEGIKTEVKSINEMCTLRYDSLKQENSKLKWIIGFLLTIGCLLLYLLTIKRKIL